MTTDFKRNSSGRTRKYQYSPPPPINALVSPLTETHVPIHALISFIGSPTLGEHFNPAKDCSDIVDNLPEATDGFYWIKPTNGKLSKVKIIKSSQKRY